MTNTTDNTAYLYGWAKADCLDSAVKWQTMTKSVAEKGNAKLKRKFDWSWVQLCSLPEALAARKMREALEKLLADYKEGADSGDWGNWDFEGMPVVKRAREALRAAGGAQ